jgi:hypothetical protein
MNGGGGTCGSRRTRRRLIAALCALAVPTLVVAPVGSATAANPGAIVDLRVSFGVHNANTSAVACPSDGKAYRLRGHLTGPAVALYGSGRRAVTLYLHGFNVAEYMWRAGDVPGYHYAREMARLGHVSLTVDRLGWDSSGHPQGEQACAGSAADVAHQLIRKLRSGRYLTRGGRPVAFHTVVLAGHDSGGTIAQIESYSYRDIDGLIVLDYSDTGFTPTIMQWSMQAGIDCAQGGKPSYPGGPGGYVDLGPTDNDEELARLAFPNTDPAVIEAAFRHRRRNPCGELESIPAAAATDIARLGEVDVPVLIGAGDQDVAFTVDGEYRQRSFFTGSDDVRVQIYPNNGHFPMAGRNAPIFRTKISRWLRNRDFVTGAG